jgi:hypothetical protein
MKTLTVETQVRRQMIDVTARVQEIVTESSRPSGLVICFVPHTTAAITINENADPDVARDILYKLVSRRHFWALRSRYCLRIVAWCWDAGRLFTSANSTGLDSVA